MKLRRMKQAREGTDRRIIIVKQGKARKGKLSETWRSAERCGEVQCAEKVEMWGRLDENNCEVKCHVVKSRGVT